MNIQNLIYQHGLQPADVIVVGRSLGLAAHYLVYMGEGAYGPYFMANLESGVKRMSLQEVQRRSGEFFFKRIRRFDGNHYQRQQALQRAHNANGRSYSLTSFNCEHFANLVQFGEASSQQVQAVGTVAVVSLAFLVLGAIFGGGGDGRSSKRYS